MIDRKNSVVNQTVKGIDFLMNKNKILEWTGVITAIVYSLLVALNIGAEFLGFALLLISAILIGLWAYLGCLLYTSPSPRD